MNLANLKILAEAATPKTAEQLRARIKEVSDKIDKIVFSGGRVSLTDPLSVELHKLTTQLKKVKAADKSGKTNLKEAKDYSDSGDFTDEFYGDLHGAVRKVEHIVKAPRWMNYMKMTDVNFGTNTVPAAKALIEALGDLKLALRQIDAEFDKAD